MPPSSTVDVFFTTINLVATSPRSRAMFAIAAAAYDNGSGADREQDILATVLNPGLGATLMDQHRLYHLGLLLKAAVSVDLAFEIAAGIEPDSGDL